MLPRSHVIPHPLSGRIRKLNADMRRLAAHRGVLLVDFEPIPATTYPNNWSADRLHLNVTGHSLVARAVADALRIPGSDASWQAIQPPCAASSVTVVATEIRWTIQHLLPWIRRRVGRGSSRDTIEAKRPQLLAVTV